MGYVDSMVEYIHTNYPGIKRVNRRGLYRMKQFYELYAGNEKVSAVMTQFKLDNCGQNDIYFGHFLFRGFKIQDYTDNCIQNIRNPYR